MVRDPSSHEEEPDPGEILSALSDDDAVEMIAALDRPKTASQISEECDIPLSTTYRKLERLTRADLLQESTEIRRDGQHTTLYSVAFESVIIELDDQNELDVDLSRPERAKDQRLAALWSEVREET